MSAGAGIGMIVMLGAALFGLWCLVRAMLGPGRKTSLGHAGYSVFLIVAGAIAVGTGVPARPVPTVAATSGATEEPPAKTQVAPAPTTVPAPAPAPEPVETREEPAAETEPAPVLGSEEPFEVARIETPATVPTVSARYQTSYTLVSLVIADFSVEERDALMRIAKAECSGSEFCSVGFWTDDAKAPRTLRMTDDAVAGRLAHYVHSSATGLDTLRWNCAVVDIAGADCLQ